jgi:hypothetical protein
MKTISDLLARLSDTELVSEVKRLAKTEAHAIAHLVASLAVLDARRSYLEEGYSSTFGFCVQSLGLSESAAFYRIKAARAARRFPVILERLANGSLTLKAVRMLKPHLTKENHLELLDAAAGKTRREIELIVAALDPKPDVPATVRKLPARRTAAVPAPVDVGHQNDAAVCVPVTPDEGGSAGASSDGGPGASPSGVASDRAADVRGNSSESVAASAATSVATAGAPAPEPLHDFGDGIREAPASIEAFGTPSNTPAQSPGSAPSVLQPAPAMTSPPCPDVIAPACGSASAVSEPPTATSSLLSRQNTAPVVNDARHRGVVEPLTPERYRVQLTISAETHARLRRAQDLLRHQLPNGDLAVVFDRALTLLVTELERKKIAAVSRPRGSKGDVSAGRRLEDTKDKDRLVVENGTGPGRPLGCNASLQPVRANGSNQAGRRCDDRGEPIGNGEAPRGNSRYIPADVKRRVWERDEGRCRFVGSSGHRCAETSMLEFHHVIPYAVGGKATVHLTELRCSSHNRHEAARYFGLDQLRFRKSADDG